MENNMKKIIMLMVVLFGTTGGACGGGAANYADFYDVWGGDMYIDIGVIATGGVVDHESTKKP